MQGRLRETQTPLLEALQPSPSQMALWQSPASLHAAPSAASFAPPPPPPPPPAPPPEPVHTARDEKRLPGQDPDE